MKSRDLATAGAKRASFRTLLEREFAVRDVTPHELVFGELVTNALRYGRDPMSVAVDVDGRTVRISVEDSGRCFDLDDTLEAEPSTSGGRGLKIVRSISTSLTVECTPTLGCRVTAVVPL